MALLVLVVYPLQRQAEAEGKETAFFQALSTRFRPLANFSLLVLLVTGVVQTGEDSNYGGLLQFDTAWSQAILGKHIAFAGMVGAVAFLQFGLTPALERARLLTQSDPQAPYALERRTRMVMRVNFALGLIVLFFTALATAL
jgi:uncharacterized membrane protein